MGAPIPVDKIESPTKEDVDALHKRYIEALTDLFETHKENYGIPEDQHLNLV